MNADSKPWWESFGVTGSRAGAGTGLATLAVAVAKIAGYEIDFGATELLISSAVALVSAAISWYGRVRATTRIDAAKILPGLTLESGK